MKKNRSTRDLELSSNESLFMKKRSNSFFKYPLINNVSSKYLKFYTFHAGFKKKLDDLLIVIFNEASNVVSAYSKTSTPAAPIIWNKKNNRGWCKILIVNSGNANAHTGTKGVRAIDFYAKNIATKFNCPLSQILVSSTGVIGEQLNYQKIKNTYNSINKYNHKKIIDAAKAIMTTDTYPKTVFKKFKVGKKEIKIFGFAKGSGMIAPNMGTMLAYIFIEANVSNKILKEFLNSHLETSFNSISVDGDTSTNDTVMLFSINNDKKEKISKKIEIKKISDVLQKTMFELAIQIVSDGEGISKLMKINVYGASTKEQASKVAFSVANSQLVKTAIAGQDANWGRVIMAIGKADRKILQEKIKLQFGKLIVAYKGMKYNKININKLNQYMKNKVIEININLGIGNFNKTVYSSDLTHEYIRINADYRS